MTDTPLVTKLRVPPLRQALVPRERLLGRLDRALKCSVCLVSAPAGFGKTTLVAEWAARCPASVAWLSLDEADNDPARFLAYVVAALQRIQIDVGQSTLAMLQAPRLPPLPTLSLRLINEIDDVATDLVLVLVDTGLGLHDYSHPTRKVRFFRFDFGIHDDPDSVAVRQVARLGYAPDAVRHIVMTHLHFDHAGGLPDFPHVQVHCTGVRLRRCGTLAPGSSWLTTGRISRMGRHPRSRRLALPVRRCPAHQCPVRHYAPMAQPSGPWCACPSPAGLGRRPSRRPLAGWPHVALLLSAGHSCGLTARQSRSGPRAYPSAYFFLWRLIPWWKYEGFSDPQALSRRHSWHGEEVTV